MSNRAASATIQGYYYQFEKTILEILRLTGNSDYVIVEGIEDIDLSTATDTTAIQCKYLSGQKYQPSIIRPAIQLMLTDHVGRGSPIKYQLYVHFKDSSGLPAQLDLDQLKKLLTFKHKGTEVLFHRDNGISDKVLNQFVTNLTITAATDFENQHCQVIKELKSQFSCGGEEAECFFFNNALRFIIDTASQKGAKNRRVARQSFIEQINSRNLLFSKWLLLFKGREKYISLIKQNLKKSHAFQSQKQKALFLNADVLKRSSKEFGFVHFVNTLLSAYFEPGKHLYDACPWTIVLDADEAVSRQLKSSLLSKEIMYFDGYETVEFSADLFNRRPVKTKELNNKNKPTERLGASSYVVRIVTFDTYKQHRNKISAPDVFFFFSDAKPTMIVDGSNCQIFQIDDTLTLKEVASIIVPN